jgi:preprotein translocase subunit YajC
LCEKCFLNVIITLDQKKNISQKFYTNNKSYSWQNYRINIQPDKTTKIILKRNIINNNKTNRTSQRFLPKNYVPIQTPYWGIDIRRGFENFTETTNKPNSNMIWFLNKSCLIVVLIVVVVIIILLILLILVKKNKTHKESENKLEVVNSDEASRVFLAQLIGKNVN